MANEGPSYPQHTGAFFSWLLLSFGKTPGVQHRREIVAGLWRAVITPARTHKPPCQEHISSLAWVLTSRSERWACPLPAVWRVSVHKRAF